MNQLEKLKQQFQNYKDHGSLKETADGNWEQKSKEYKTKEGREDQIRLLLYPDGDICKEFDAIEKVDLEEVPGWKYPKDNLPLCPKRNFGERSAFQDYASSLYEGLEDKDAIDPVSKKLFKTLMPTKFFVFKVLVRGMEEFGPKYFKVKDIRNDEQNNDYLKIMDKVLSSEYQEDGGFVGDKALDFKATGKKNAGGFKVNSLEPTRKPTPLLPKGCPLSKEEIDNMNNSPQELFKRITYEESEQLLEKHMKRWLHEQGIEQDDIPKYGASEPPPQSELDKKFAAFNGDDEDIPF